MTCARTAPLCLWLALNAGCSHPEAPKATRPDQVVAQTSAVQTAQAKGLAWQAFVERSIEEYLAIYPSTAVAFGRHEFDGQIPDWSEAALTEHGAAFERMRTQAASYTDAELTAEERFQRAYFVSRMDNELFGLREAREPYVNPAYYFDAGLDPSTYVSMPYAPAEQRLRAFIAYARKVPASAAQIRKNLQQPLPRTFIDYASAGFRGFLDFYRSDVPQAFAEVKSPELQAELTAVLKPAGQALQELAEWLESGRASATEQFALGPERFARMLQQTEAVTTPLPQLLDIGQADLERNLKALETACARYLPGGTLRACVDKQAADKPDGGAVLGARKQLDELKQFVASHALVTIPGDSQARVDEAPAYRRQNFAYIDIPGPYEQKLSAVYYIAPPDPAWSKSERDAYIPGKADLMFTSVHEVWPGHFLQFLHSNRSPWRFGQLFVGYAFAEGWAHYAEELMIEEGLAQDKPALWVGQLLNALLRNVRFVCAIGLHTQNMSVQTCEDLFRDKAFQDAGNARQQAARGTYDPGYLNYTLGKLLLRKLRSDWRAENPGRPIREFHDAVLDAGGPPIPLLRALLLKQPPAELF